MKESTYKLLKSYEKLTKTDIEFYNQSINFLENYTDYFNPYNSHGHFTVSGWIVNERKNKVLLINSSKYDSLLQPGGHIEPFDLNLIEAVKREIFEETGLKQFSYFDKRLFDIDIHSISDSKQITKHLHYDLRFFFIANIHENLKRNYESKSLGWYDLDEIMSLSDSFKRLVTKTKSF